MYRTLSVSLTCVGVLEMRRVWPKHTACCTLHVALRASVVVGGGGVALMLTLVPVSFSLRVAIIHVRPVFLTGESKEEDGRVGRCTGKR